MDVVIAGGGFAGLEALLGLHAVAGERVKLTLVAPEREFMYRPMAVAEPFARGQARRVALAAVAADAGADVVTDALAGVDVQAGEARLAGGARLRFEALLVATGARPVVGVEGAATWWPDGDPEVLGGLLRDVEEGYSKRVAIVIPPGAVWPLPAYELAILTAGEARAMARDDLEITVLTPEAAPLSLFGPQASAAMIEELERAGVGLRTGVVARREHGGLVLEPGGERFETQRVLAIPRLLGPAIDGLAADEEGFIRTGPDGRVEGCERVWAAGDGVVSPLKFGGLATHQARVAVRGIARCAGVDDVPDPGEPVLHGQLLVDRGLRRLRPGGGAEGAPLWWPQGKVAGEYLPRWLSRHGFGPAHEQTPPDGRAVTIRQPLRTLPQPEVRRLFDVGRQYRIADPDIAALGRRMRALRSR